MLRPGPTSRHVAPILPAVVFQVALLSGCVATKYQHAPPDRPSAVTLDLRPRQSPEDIYLDEIIVRRGPGSWKRDALWDEYVLSVANRTTRPWQIESARIVDSTGHTVEAGSDPWELERLTADWWREQGADFGPDVVWGLGEAVGVVGKMAAVVSIAVLERGVVSGPVASGAIGVAITASTVQGGLRAPADANAASKEEIETEFRHRREALLGSLPPGRETRGSAFFPMTRDPRQLVLVCRSGNETRNVVIDLPAARDEARRHAEPGDLHIYPAAIGD